MNPETIARRLRHIARNKKHAAKMPKPTYTCMGVHEDLLTTGKIPTPPTNAERVHLATTSPHGNFMRALAPVLREKHPALKGPQKIKVMGFVWSKMQPEYQAAWARA